MIQKPVAKYFSGRLSLPALALAALTLLAAPSLTRGQADTVGVTLEELIARALESSPQVLASYSAVDRAGGMQTASLAGSLPHLKLSEVFTRGNNPVMVFGTKLRQGGFTSDDFQLSALNRPGAATNYATVLSLEQPLFNGGKSYFGRRQAGAYRSAAAAGARQAVLEATYQVRRSYYSLILAREHLGVIEAALASGRSHVHQAQQRFNTGLATRADVLKASVRLSELEQQRIKALDQATVAGEYLKLAAGWRESAPLKPLDRLTERELTVSLDSLISFAVEHQPSLAASRHAAEAADFGAKASRGEAIPHLNGFFVYERNGLEAFGREADNWMAGVALEWNLFDGFGNLGKIKSSRAEREKAGYEAALMGHRVEVEVREAYLGAKSSLKMVEVAVQAADQARESLRIVENQYNEGLATITDLLDTDLSSLTARLNVVQALYEHNLALASLELASGGYEVW